MRKRLKKKLTKKLLTNETMTDAFHDAFVSGIRDIIVKKVFDEFFEENRIFICAMCGDVSARGSEKEAEAELQENFPGAIRANCESICDDCWHQVRPDNNVTSLGEIGH